MIERFRARVRAAFLLGLLVLMSVFAAPAARADNPIRQYGNSMRGNLNFTGTEETLRLKDNAQPCQLVSGGSVYADLAGIPKGATVKAAHLYWAGSGTKPDYTVTFEGSDVTAPPDRQYVTKASSNRVTYTYFSGAVDVTTTVKKKGNGRYKFSGLDVATGSPWCAVQGVVGGFALLVIYESSSEPFRMLNLYEGFQDFQNTSMTINLGNFSVPNPLPSGVTARVGHLTWEGDSTLSQDGEDLLFNDKPMTDDMNKAGNQFNSQSNITGDKYSYGIDFDVYTVQSPTIQGGQNTASSTYKSGQDLVLLSAEIVAMPYIEAADLSVSMIRTGDLTVGNQVKYTISVSNVGTDTEIGPVTVVDTLSAGLDLVSTSGSGWTCTSLVQADGKTVVTCTQKGPYAAGAKLPDLTVIATPSAGGSVTNTVTVSGKSADYNSVNNKASDSGTAAAPPPPPIVFTKETCNVIRGKIVTAPDATGCHTFIGPVTAADTATRIYLTTVADGYASPQNWWTLSGVADTVELQATCQPSSDVKINYAGVTLTCNDTKWVKANIVHRFAQPTVGLPDGGGAQFTYPDIGQVTLSVRFQNTVSSVTFVSRPTDIRFKEVVRASDGYPDQGGVSDTWSKPDTAFAKAGEPFLLRVGAVMADGKWAPSFGTEADAQGLKLDWFLMDTAARKPTADENGVAPDMSEVLIPSKPSFTFNNTKPTGTLEAKASWYEAGNFAITPSLENYLGSGRVGGAPDNTDDTAAARIVAGTRLIGRFYPDHFTTKPTRNFVCLPEMNCPASPGYPVDGATYSLQPFKFSVTAYGLPKPSGEQSQLSLFQIADPTSKRALKLSAAKAPNLADAPTVGGLDEDPSSQLKAPAVDEFPVIEGTATYKLGAPYNPADRLAKQKDAAWGAPTAVYLRATMKESRGILNSTNIPSFIDDTVSSIVPAGAVAGTQYEGGLMVVSGRLFVPNVFGSELLRLPLPLTAQYWSGSTWAANVNDVDSVVASGFTLASCTRSFAADAKGSCKAGVLSAAGDASAIRLSGGKAMRYLKSPGRGNNGSIDFTVKSNAAPWLPSTQARATFGLYKAPLIYLREVY
jgi:MSHA biogenesis protein MshQ